MLASLRYDEDDHRSRPRPATFRISPLRDPDKGIAGISSEGPGRRPPGQISDAADSTAQAKAHSKARARSEQQVGATRGVGSRGPIDGLSCSPMNRCRRGVERRRENRQDGDARCARACGRQASAALRLDARTLSHGIMERASLVELQLTGTKQGSRMSRIF